MLKIRRGGKRQMKHTYFRCGLSVLLCLCMVLSLLSGVFTLPGRAASTPSQATEQDTLFTGEIDLDDVDGLDLTNATHFIFRHWHAVDASGQPGGADVANSVLVAGYIVPDGSGGYTVYARAYNSGDGTEDNPDTDLREDLDNFVLVTESTKSRYLSLSGNKLTIMAAPRNDGTLNEDDEPANYYESFSGFSVVTGQGAVDVDNMANRAHHGELVIDLSKTDYVHLIKSHLFYISETAAYTGSTTYPGSAGLAFPDYVDAVYSDSDGKTYYNSAEGLHTDAAATAVGTDGRTFDVDLLSWYNGANLNVGFVLDASGSMAFTVDDPAKIHLTDEQIKAIETATNRAITKLTSSSPDWSEVFLTDAQLAYILNPAKTDNSSLGVNGYSYYVDNNGEISPLGYWQGVRTETPNIPYAFAQDGNDPIFGWASNYGHDKYNFSGSYGLRTSTTANVTKSSNGIVLDVTPSSGDFTISFVVRKDGTDSDINAIASLLYIGPMNGDTDAGNFFHVYRDSGDSSNRLKGAQAIISSTNPTNFNNVFGNTISSYRVTLVFKNAGTDHGTVTSYISNSGSTSAGATGVQTSSGPATLNTPITDYHIIINGFKNDYNGSPIFIDDLYVIDKALESGEVTTLHNNPANYSNDAMIGKYMFENGNANYTDNGRDWLWNSMKARATGDHDSHTNEDSYAKQLREQVDITAAAPDASVPTVAYAPDGYTVIGSINLSNSDAKNPNRGYNHTAAGWYFVSHAGSYPNFYAVLGTGKRLYGINGTNTSLNSSKRSITDDQTGAVYSPESDVPTQFYVDANGYLRCFYGNGNSTAACSYVYELSDTQYVRTETLQRALGVFTSSLYDASSSAMVSAVRFSASDLTDSGAVLLDWTNDPVEMTKMVSLQWGSGSATASENSGDSAFSQVVGSGIDQYNFGLTGGTYTDTGLAAFRTQLAERLNTYEDAKKIDQSSKYIILFTDGNVNNGSDGANAKAAVEEAKNLHDNYGYTIIPIALLGETDTTTRGDVKEFLEKLAEVNTNQDETYFANWDADTFIVSDTQAMVTLLGEIMDQIVKHLNHYSVKQYIDPRFDLLDREGVRYYLNADGSVTFGSETTTVDGTTGLEITFADFKQDQKTGDDERYYGGTATLYYDETVEMYYLEWTDQTIPSQPVSATNLNVWHGQYTLVAKGDFIGGNNVLLTGNAANMNMVYFPEQTDDNGDVLKDDYYSSGIDDMYRFGETPAGWSGYTDPSKDPGDDDYVIRGTADDYPSKGFPRVTANVELLDLTIIGSSENRIYLGEVIDPMEAIKQLGNTLNRDDYWVDYLKRYARSYYADTAAGKTDDQLLEDLLTELIKVPNEWGFDIPYFYLPYSGDGNTVQAGVKQQSDQLGILHYRWERLNPDTGEVIGVGGYGTSDDDGAGPYKGEPYETLDTRRIEYRLVVSYWPFPDENDEFWDALDAWEKDAARDKTKYETITDFLDAMRAELDGEVQNGEKSLSAIVQSALTAEEITDKIDYLEDKVMDGAPEDIAAAPEFADRRVDILAHVNGQEEDNDKGQEAIVGLSELFSKLAELRAKLADTTDSGERADLQSEIAEVEHEIDQKKITIDVLIQEMVNYINYLRWCYGYKEETDKETGKTTGSYGTSLLGQRDTNNAALIDEPIYDEDGDPVYEKDENGNDVTDENNNPIPAEAYATPKDPVGEDQYNKGVNGVLLTRVVRGELAFEMTFNLFELNYMFAGAWKNKATDGVTYTVNVTRAYDATKELESSGLSGNAWKPVIPDLEIKITKADVDKLKDGTSSVDGEVVKNADGTVTLYYPTTYTEDTGNVTKYLYPKAIYDPSTGKVTFYSNPTVFDPVYAGYEENSDYARLLPIGTYTLTPAVTANADDWSMFDFGDGLTFVDPEDYGFNDWHFTRTEDGVEPTNTTDSVYFPRSAASYKAGFGQVSAPGETKNGSVVFELGTNEKNRSDSAIVNNIPAYTSDRVGMAAVTASLRYELPATGGPGATEFWQYGAALLLAGGLWLICLDLRAKRAK